MKTNFLFLFSVCLILLSCQKDEDSYIFTKPTHLTIPDTGGSESISIESNKSWTAESSDSWCTVSPKNGDESTKKISITLSRNETYSDRSCTVTITAGGLSKTINVIQVAPETLLVTQDKYDLSNDASTIEVEVKDYVKFNVDISHDWITQAATTGLPANKIKFDVAKNESYDNRNGTITITQKDGAISSVINIYQSQVDAIILSDKTVNLTGNKQTVEVELKTNVDFEVIVPEVAKAWVSAIETRALTNETLLLDIAQNNSGKERTTEIYVKNKESDLQDTLTINQNEEIESGHPFLIVTKDMYPALREKSSREPWKSMKQVAISRANSSPGSSLASIKNYVSTVALAYILDEKNAQTYANKVYKTIRDSYPDIVIDESWGGVVPPLGAFFVATLALDIVYDALTEAQILECENVISSKLKQLPPDGSMVDARLGAHGTWDIYKGIRTTPDNKYYDRIMGQITPDGVSPVTNTYAWTRIGGSEDEVAKSAYMDVLEFTGVDKRYYNNERIIKFQRWLYGSSVDCARNLVIFGDMLIQPATKNSSSITWRVVNYDYEAAQYVAWLFKERTPPGNILSYIIPKSALPAPKVPSSKIYNNGGAFLRDKEDDSNGLSLMLYNITSQSADHSHNEVNALSLSALGNRLLVNGGRLGYRVKPAPLNNTLTIDGKNHSSQLGDGILEGFLSDDLDFAVGAAGRSLSPNTHKRNAVLVHSTATVPGYFIIFDEVKAKANNQVKNYLHPANESSIQEITSLTEYTAKIDLYPTAKNVSASFYYLTPPNAVNIEKVRSASIDRYPDYPQHNRLEAVYDVDKEGNKNTTTIVYPFSNTLPKATFDNVGNADFSACAIPHGIATDYIIQPATLNTNKQMEVAGSKVIADFSLIRKIGEEVSFYLVKNGISFSSGEIGFQSSNKVTVYANKTKGTIISSGATIKLVGPGMDKVAFSPSAKALSSGSGFIEVELKKGTFSFN